MDVLMPQLGETVAEGKISKWFVSAGDAVKPGDNLFEIETDKVSMEVPAISAGTLAAIHVQAGEVAPVGAVVAVIEGKGETVSLIKPQTPLVPAKTPSQTALTSAKAVQGQEPDPRVRGDERVTGKPFVMEPFREVRSPERNYGPARLAGGTFITPLARRLAGEAGIDLSKIKGSGPHGRIVAADIETVRKAPPPAQTQAAANIILTADITIGQSLALCEQANAAQKLALELTDVIVKAWAAALARHRLAEHQNIALTVGNDRSLIHNVEAKSLSAIATARRDPSDDAAGASTAISIPGVPGIASVTGVLRPPQTTLLSIAAPRRAPVEARDGSVKFADMLTATLTCDAQALDAALGAQLLAAFKGFFEQPVTMIV
jgi:pyruvate dehydrogenase E2 component (dihydrolipoamide acetyltransferase)